MTGSENLVSSTWTKSFLTNVLQDSCTFPTKLRLVDLSENAIYNVSSFCFKRLKFLAILLLTGNDITTLPANVFVETQSLKKVDISRNCLIHLSSTMLAVQSLIILNISQNSFVDFSQDLTGQIKTIFISTDDYRLCCLLTDSPAICTADPSWPMSCNVLLDSLAAEVSSATTSILLLILNTVASLTEIIQIVLSKKEKYHFDGNVKLVKKQTLSTSFTTNIIWQNMNDILFGVYTVIVFAISRYYGETFPVFAPAWLSSIFCSFLTFLSGFTVLNSLYVANHTAISRLFATKYPFKLTFKNTKTNLKALVSGSVGVSAFCTLCVSIYCFVEGQERMSSVMCTFTGRTNQSPSVITLTSTTAAVEICVFVSIFIQYVVICMELSKPSQMTCSIDRSSQQTSVIIQAVVLLLSYALCWLPSAAKLITSVSMTTYPIQLLAWNVMLILPLVSVINPLIYCFFPLLKQKVKKN